MDLGAIARALSLDPGRVTVTSLSGGVSSDIFLLEAPGGARYVVKQSLPRLRVAAEWKVDPSRIFREIDALRVLASVCAVPEVVYEDRQSFVYAMTAAPADAEPWKAKLLRGEADPLVAGRIGQIHAAMMAQSGFDDLGFFEELRIEPYYTYTAAKHPGIAAVFERAAEACRRKRRGLVHGDWSPKNILVDSAGSPLALDFECVHFGDPAYDAAFLLNHLLLKSIHRPASTEAYEACARAYLEPTANRITLEEILIHLPPLLLARVDGKSPVEYLTKEQTQAEVRRLAYGLIEHAPASPSEIWLRLKG